LIGEIKVEQFSIRSARECDAKTDSFVVETVARASMSVKLLSSDDETYEVDKAIAQMSVTIKNMLDGE
jgi:hypothetical protein